MSLSPDDLPSRAQCTCVLVARGVALTSGCPLHHPFLGLLVEQPVKFMGIPVFTDPEPAPE